MKFTPQDISKRIKALKLLSVIAEKSEEIRKDLLTKFPDTDGLSFLFSKTLQSELDKINLKSRIIEGTVQIGDDSKEEYHVWLELDEYLVDGTLDQFDNATVLYPAPYISEISRLDYYYTPLHTLNQDGSYLT